MSTVAAMPQRISTPTSDAETAAPLTALELEKLDGYWRALNYLAVGQIYLLGNPLLKEPLKREHIKPRLLGHWGTSPGLNMLCVHLNRVIKKDDLNMISRSTRMGYRITTSMRCSPRTSPLFSPSTAIHG
jgi:xylulose-5-phosphate/fructose-6-phosphate phosphoketolase